MASWREVPGGAHRGGWTPSTAYRAGDTVRSPSGSLQEAKADFTSGASYDATKWSALAGAPEGALNVLDYARSLNIPLNANGEIGPGVDATPAITAAIADATAKINSRNHAIPLRFPAGFYDCISSPNGTPTGGGGAIVLPPGLSDYLDLYFEDCQFRLNQFADRPAGSAPAAGAVSGPTRFIDLWGGSNYSVYQNLRMRGRAKVDAGGFAQYAGVDATGNPAKRREHILFGNWPAGKNQPFGSFQNIINEADLEVFNIPADGNNQFSYCWIVAIIACQLTGYGVAAPQIYGQQLFYKNIRTGHGPGRITARGGMTGIVMSGSGVNADQVAGLAWVRNGRVCNVIGDDLYIENFDHDSLVPQVTGNTAAAFIQIGQGAVNLKLRIRNVKHRGASADVGIECDNVVDGLCENTDVSDCYTAPYLTTNVVAADPNVENNGVPRQDMYAAESVFTWRNCKGQALTDWNRTLGGDANSNSMIAGFYAYQYPTNGPAGEVRIEDCEVVRKSPIFPRLSPAAAIQISGPVRRLRVENFRNTIVDFTHASGGTVGTKGLVVSASRGHTCLVEVDGWRDEIIGTIDGAGSALTYTQFQFTGNDVTASLKNVTRRRIEITRTNGGGGLTYQETDWGGSPAQWVDGFSATASQTDPAGVALTSFVTDWFDGSVPGKADLSVAGNNLALTANFGVEHRLWNAAAGYHVDGAGYVKATIPTNPAGFLAKALGKGIVASSRLTAATTLPADGSPTTLPVGDTSNFSPTGGLAYIGPIDNLPQYLIYTGVTATTLTGVTNYTPGITLQVGQLVKTIHSWVESGVEYAADGLSANLVLRQIVKGAATVLASIPIAPLPVAGSSVWVRWRFNRGVLYGDYFNAAAPGLGTTPVLTSGPQVADPVFGNDKLSVPSLHGIALASADATAVLDDSTLNTFNILRSLLVDDMKWLHRPVGVTVIKGLITEADPGYGPTPPGQTEIGRVDLRNVDHSRLTGLSGLTVPISYIDGSSRDKVFITAYTPASAIDLSQPAVQATPSTSLTTLRAPEANSTTRAYYQAGAQTERHTFGAGVAIARSRDATQPKVEQQTWLTIAATLSQTVATTLTVADTSKFPAAGLCVVAGTLCSYTGKTATTLTGVLALAAATPAQFSIVQTLQYAPTVIGAVTYLTAQASLSTTGSTVTVLDTSGFPATGTFQLAGKAVTYTGKTATTFTGATITTGTATAQPTDRAFIVSTAYGELILEPNEWMQISYVAGAFPSQWTKAITRS